MSIIIVLVFISQPQMQVSHQREERQLAHLQVS